MMIKGPWSLREGHDDDDATIRTVPSFYAYRWNTFVPTQKRLFPVPCLPPTIDFCAFNYQILYVRPPLRLFPRQVHSPRVGITGASLRRVRLTIKNIVDRLSRV
jgi:hypothetical protein